VGKEVGMRAPSEVIGLRPDDALVILENNYCPLLTVEDLERIAAEEIGDYPISIKVKRIPPREDFYHTKHSRQGNLEAYLLPMKTGRRYLGDAELLLHPYLQFASEEYVRDVVRHELRHYRSFLKRISRV
jgi:hypothetical protein